MAKYHGNKGALYVDLPGAGAAPTPVANLTKWSFDGITDKVDATACGDLNKSKVVGLPDTKGTYAGFLDDTAADLYLSSQDGIARKFYLYSKTTAPQTYWYGLGFFDQSSSGGVNEIAAMSGTIEAGGPILRNR